MLGSSCGETEEAGDEGALRRHVIPEHGAHLSLGQHGHSLHPGQRPPRRPEAREAEHRPGQAFDAAVVLLDGLIANLNSLERQRI